MATRIELTNIFKRVLVEESLPGSATRARSSRRFNIFHQHIIRRRKDCTAGKPARDNNHELPVRAALILELERIAGKLTLENEPLKRERRSWMPPPAGLSAEPQTAAWVQNSP